MTPDEILQAAIDKKTPEERAAFLDAACGQDAALRQQVEGLLKANDQAGSFLEQPLFESSPTVEQPLVERPGAVIGPYKLLEQIGEGGFGVVFMAEQQEPVRRKVALKVVKPGMDTRQVVARFQAERQALALMEHPNIAHVFDGGETASGRPYFVMELVRGIPITDFCDQNHLSVRARLELFGSVCQAVQHAHQKGIIHRDIKPSNVLVTLHDDKPVVKVIDFGIAKATGQQLTEKTLFTNFAQMIGTPMYMSPEQAQMSGLDIDTRSDIYSLGVLLYELLTGTTPLTTQRLKEAALAEVLRVIREEEPPRPSTRLSESKDALVSISAQRATEPAKLTKLVRGELDWIVMKALEKDRNRRYETANSFALDVQRHLADEPVQACPPSAGYRLRKYVRRHKAGLAVAALVLFFLVLLGGGGGWMLRDRAAQQALLDVEIERALADVEALYQRDKTPDAQAALARAEALLAGGRPGEELRRLVQEWRANLDEVDKLERIRLEHAIIKREGVDWIADSAYRQALARYGLDSDTPDPAEVAERIKASPIKNTLLAALDDWVLVKWGAERPGWEPLLTIARRVDDDRCRDRLRQTPLSHDWQSLVKLAQAKEKIADDNQAHVRICQRLEDLTADPDILAQPPSTVLLLSQMLRRSGKIARAEELLRLLQNKRPGDFWTNYFLAMNLVYRQPAKPGQAVGFFRAARALRPDDPLVITNLAAALQRDHQLAEAEELCRKLIKVQPNIARAHSNLGAVLYRQDRFREAEQAYERALALDPTDAEHHYYLGMALASQDKLAAAEKAFLTATELKASFHQAHDDLGVCLEKQEKHAEAEKAHRKAIDINPKYAQAYSNLGSVLLKQDRFAEAIKLCRQAIALEPALAMAHNNLGVSLAHLDQLDEAEKELREAIRLDAKLGLAPSNLGIVLLKKGNPVQALAECRTGVKLVPNYAEAHNNLGLVLYTVGRAEEAETALREAIRLREDYAMAHSNLGLALAAQKKYPDAEAACLKAVLLKPKWAHGHNNVGHVLNVQGKPAEAEEHCRKAVDLDPDYGDARGGLGFALFGQNKYAEAVVQLEAAVRLKPDWLTAQHRLGHACARTGQWSKAATAFERYLELGPADSTHWCLSAALRLHLGDEAGYRRGCDAMLSRFGDTDNPVIAARVAEMCSLVPGADVKRIAKLADTTVAATAAKHPSSGYLRRVKALTEIRAGNYSAALESLKPLSPKVNGGCVDATVFAILAMAQHHLGRDQEAGLALAGAWGIAAMKMPDLDKEGRFEADWGSWIQYRILCREAEVLLQSKEGDRTALAKAHNYHGVFLSQQRKLRAAATQYRKAIELKGDYFEAHNNLGLALLQQGRLADAAAQFRKLIELKSDFPEGHYHLANILREQGKLADAVAAFETALRLKPRWPEAHHEKGVTLAKQGKDAEAEAEFTKAIALNKDYVVAYFELGNALFGQKKMAEAVAGFEQAIKRRPDFFQAHHNLGIVLASTGKFDDAIACFRQALRVKADYAAAKKSLAHALNDKAWGAVSMPPAATADAAKAVLLAKEAVDLDPAGTGYMNTLGVAHYRAGNWKEAIAALVSSTELNKGGGCEDWFFLAMAHWKLGHKDDARKWHARAAEWMMKNEKTLQKEPQLAAELRRFQAEAEALLELTKKND